MVNVYDEVYCFLVMVKLRVIFLKFIIVLRLEFVVVVVLTNISVFFRKELKYDFFEVFWIDSKVVFGYLLNEVRRFYIFVVNRV